MPSLYFVDDLCPSCPKYLFNSDSKKWKKSRQEPGVADHVVVDFREKVVHQTASGLVYRNIGKTDTRMWDGSIPDNMPILDHRLIETEAVMPEEDDLILEVTPDERKRVYKV